MKILTTILLGLFLAPFTSFSQYSDLGVHNLPADNEPVDDLIYYGEALDFSGGYQVGDTAANFTVYDFDGNPLNFYEQLEGDKPVLLFSGSVSCLRYRNSFPNPGENSTQEYFAIDQFFQQYSDQFNLIFIYGIEAHPTDGNCPSNCPPTTSNDTTVVQAPDYLYRKWAMKTWADSPNFDFDHPIYCDNPDNAVYNTFFQRPFGLLAFNCDGTVALRGDWANEYMMTGTNALLSFANNYSSCEIDWPAEEEEEENTGEEEEEEEEEENTGEEEEEEEEEDDEPIYDGPAIALDGDIEAEDEVVSVEATTAESSWNLFPNPATDRITLTGLPVYNTHTVKVLNIAGAVVFSDVVGSSRADIQLSDLPAGIYIVEVQSSEGILGRKRLILR